MTNPLLGPIAAPGASLAELDARARDILRRIVETYLETGDPVGSRTISRGGVHLSPASIRNTMQDLTELGLLGSPHASAGRMQTSGPSAWKSASKTSARPRSRLRSSTSPVR